MKVQVRGVLRKIDSPRQRLKPESLDHACVVVVMQQAKAMPEGEWGRIGLKNYLKGLRVELSVKYWADPRHQAPPTKSRLWLPNTSLQVIALNRQAGANLQ